MVPLIQGLNALIYNVGNIRHEDWLDKLLTARTIFEHRTLICVQ